MVGGDVNQKRTMLLVMFSIVSVAAVVRWKVMLTTAAAAVVGGGGCCCIILLLQLVVVVSDGCVDKAKISFLHGGTFLKTKS